jgi:hypothetical protein
MTIERRANVDGTRAQWRVCCNHLTPAGVNQLHQQCPATAALTAAQTQGAPLPDGWVDEVDSLGGIQHFCVEHGWRQLAPSGGADDGEPLDAETEARLQAAEEDRVRCDHGWNAAEPTPVVQGAAVAAAPEPALMCYDGMQLLPVEPSAPEPPPPAPDGLSAAMRRQREAAAKEPPTHGSGPKVVTVEIREPPKAYCVYCRAEEGHKHRDGCGTTLRLGPVHR